MIISLLCSGLMARGPVDRQALRKSAAVSTSRTLSNISNWAYWMYDNGLAGIDPTGNWGGIYPRGTMGSIYQDGFVYGGFVRGGGDPELRVGGMTYSNGMLGGWVNGTGASATPVDPNDARVRMYRIRADWATLGPTQVRDEAAEAFLVSSGSVTESQIQDIITQYKTDWIEWPVDLGAPYVDANDNGIYDPVLDGDGAADPTQGDYPGIANADQVVWQVINDFNNTTALDLYGSPSMGIEMQITTWAYDQDGADLGQIFFKKYKLINKSAFTIDSMYVANWADPDVGAAGDDLVGCDTSLSLAYAYNGNAVDPNYGQFNLNPSVVGYDFFQGPIVETGNPADTAVFDLKKVSGFKNLPMTSFGWFAAGFNDIGDPPLHEYNGTIAWYNLLRGFIPTTNSIRDKAPYTVGNLPLSSGGVATKFPLAGDPVTSSGDIDGGANNTLAPGDRRMVLASGPFSLPPWEDLNGDGQAGSGDVGVQEVVVAVVGGTGSDYLGNINVMKGIDRTAQELYNDLFRSVPKPPPGPVVTAVPQRNSIVLEWGSDLSAVARTENSGEATGYLFEGYNIYQLPAPTSPLSEAAKVATFDINNGITKISQRGVFIPALGDTGTVVVQSGADAGVQRFIHLTRDYVTDNPIFPGNTYYFAVTAYNYNPNPTLIEAKSLESSAIVIDGGIIARDPNPGRVYGSSAFSTLDVNTDAVSSDGQVEVLVLDPNQMKSADYQIFFTEVTDTAAADYGSTYWNLSRDGATVLSRQSQLANLTDGEDQAIVDGLKVKVSGPPVGINTLLEGPFGDDPQGLSGGNGWNWDNGDRWISGRAAGGETFFGGGFNGYNFFGSSLTGGTDFVDVEIRFAGDTQANQPDRWSRGFVYRRDQSYAYAGVGDIPFTAWDTENNQQLLVCFVEDANNGNDNLQWDMAWNATDGTYAADGGREYIFITNIPYGTGPDPSDPFFTAKNILNDAGEFPVLYAIWPDQRGTRPYLNEAFDLQIFASNVNTPADVFSFSAEGPSYSENLASAEVERINLFPNPYRGDNPQETSKFERKITFTHLPEKVEIRIFNVAGQQVRLLEKNAPSQFLNWDLLNESGLPVASGLYIAHVDLPDLGRQKVLKVFIIQRAEILDIF